MMMEWGDDAAAAFNQHQDNNNNNNNNDNNNSSSSSKSSGMMYVKVMTDEQLETLRKQIAVYSTICEQLVELHKSISSQHDLSAATGRLGSLYCDPFMAAAAAAAAAAATSTGHHKITARQRWTPSPLQLQILERIFDQGNGTPSKQKIKEITSDLSQHGQISETNVYNWFQNRRARSKRKQHLLASSSNPMAESDLDTEVDSFTDKKTKPELLPSSLPDHPPRPQDLCFHSPDISADLHFLGDGSLNGKMGTPPPGSYNHLYDQGDDYAMPG